MMKLTRSGLIALVFLTGCVVGGAWSPLVVPKARAQNVQRWDYFCLRYNGMDAGEMTARAKKAGTEGWEMVAAGTPNTVLWCFKRPM